MTLTLVLGGTRSGKSALAERIAGEAGDTGGQPVTYVATGAAVDGGMAARIAAHRARRPASWATVEPAGPADLPGVLAGLAGVVLLDSLGSWVAAHPGLDPDVDALVGALRSRAGDSVVVSEEVGLSVHPPTEVGRRFVDVLGSLNQAVGSVADRAVLVVAGRVLEI